MSRRMTADDYDVEETREKGWGPLGFWKRYLTEDDEEEELDGFGNVDNITTTTAGPRARRNSGPVLQVQANRGNQITKRTPTSLADAERAAEDLKERRPVIVNLERADDVLARRVIDFISGVTYALNGFYEKVGDKVFLFTPANIVIADEDEVEPGGKGLYSEDHR